ncbi:MAG TPA: metallophosphoesterase, partial [Acidimicrobiales bacterium]
MTPPRLLVVSDTHLSPRTPEADTNWDAVVRHVAATRPDLVVHAGDVSLDGALAPGDLDHARRRLDRLPVPWRAVPGNHD